MLMADCLRGILTKIFQCLIPYNKHYRMAVAGFLVGDELIGEDSCVIVSWNNIRYVNCLGSVREEHRVVLNRKRATILKRVFRCYLY